jgi:hypothetical protein
MQKSHFVCFLFSMYAWTASGQEVPIPTNHTILDTVSGDLDKDSIKELVVAYTIGVANDSLAEEGLPRLLVIYKRENTNWKVWKTSDQVLNKSNEGGMMGDPYGEMEIKKGVLWITHYGGSSWKWGFTDKYRFQKGDFYLIGYSSTNGKPCEYWEEADFNLSTGKLTVKKEYEECEDEGKESQATEMETILKKGIKITLQKRHEKALKITTPKYHFDIYLSNGRD